MKGKLTVAHNITSETIFAEQDKVAPLSIIALESARELGEKINAHLTEWAHKSGRTDDTFMVEAECPRFSSGDGKGIIKSSKMCIRDRYYTVQKTDDGWMLTAVSDTKP